MNKNIGTTCGRDGLLISGQIGSCIEDSHKKFSSVPDLEKTNRRY